MFSGVSTFSSLVDDAFIFILVISLIFFLGITFTMIYFVIRYHHTKNKVVSNIHGNTTLEVVWTVVPTILVLGMFYYGFIGYRDMRTIPEDAVHILVVGKKAVFAKFFGSTHFAEANNSGIGKIVS